jgi:hypothetical protein
MSSEMVGISLDCGMDHWRSFPMYGHFLFCSGKNLGTFWIVTARMDRLFITVFVPHSLGFSKGGSTRALSGAV